MKTYALIYATCVLVLFLSSCKKSPPDTETVIDAHVLVIYACTPKNSDVLDIVENGQFRCGLVCEPTRPSCMDVYLKALNADLTFLFNDTLFAEVKQTVASHKRYAMFFGGPSANPCKIFMEDKWPTPDSAMAQVRFVDMSSESRAYDCYANGVKLVSGIAYQGISSYSKVSAHSLLAIRFADTAGSTVGAVVDSVDVRPGGIYSIILSGSAGSTGSGLLVEKIYQNPVIPF